MAKAKVYWTPKECTAVARKLVELRNANPELSYIRAASDAAGMLAKEGTVRLRRIYSGVHVKNFMSYISAAERAAARATGTASTLQETAMDGVDIDKVSPSLKKMISEFEQTKPEPESEPESVFEPYEEVPETQLGIENLLVHACAGFVEKVAIESVRRIFSNPQIRSALSVLQNGVVPAAPTVDLPAVPKHNPVLVTPPKNRPPVVLVCGFKGFQQPALQSALGNRLQLKFWYGTKTGAGLKVLREKAQNAERVLLSVDAVGHDAVHILESMGKKILRVNGSSSSTINALEHLATDMRR